jgi:hypothetical protein
MIKFVKERLSKIFYDITVEPVVLIFITGVFILAGSEVPINVLMYKICNVEMNYPDSVCNNLTDRTHEDIQKDVQIR